MMLHSSLHDESHLSPISPTQRVAYMAGQKERDILLRDILPKHFPSARMQPRGGGGHAAVNRNKQP